MKDVLGADGINLINSCGAAAWQTVFHFHVHVVPRYDDDPLKLPWVPEPGDPMRSRRPPPNCEVTMAETETKTAPVRLERDGNVAVMVLDNPPVNLFGIDAWRRWWTASSRSRAPTRGHWSGAPRATFSPAGPT